MHAQTRQQVELRLLERRSTKNGERRGPTATLKRRTRCRENIGMCFRPISAPAHDLAWPSRLHSTGFQVCARALGRPIVASITLYALSVSFTTRRGDTTGGRERASSRLSRLGSSCFITHERARRNNHISEVQESKEADLVVAQRGQPARVPRIRRLRGKKAIGMAKEACEPAAMNSSQTQSRVGPGEGTKRDSMASGRWTRHRSRFGSSAVGHVCMSRASIWFSTRLGVLGRSRCPLDMAASIASWYFSCCLVVSRACWANGAQCLRCSHNEGNSPSEMRANKANVNRSEADTHYAGLLPSGCWRVTIMPRRGNPGPLTACMIHPQEDEATTTKHRYRSRPRCPPMPKS